MGAVDAGSPILLADGRGSRMTRSVVYDARDGSVVVVVGEEASRRAGNVGKQTLQTGVEEAIHRFTLAA